MRPSASPPNGAGRSVHSTFWPGQGVLVKVINKIKVSGVPRRVVRQNCLGCVLCFSLCRRPKKTHLTQASISLHRKFSSGSKPSLQVQCSPEVSPKHAHSRPLASLGAPGRSVHDAVSGQGLATQASMSLQTPSMSWKPDLQSQVRPEAPSLAGAGLSVQTRLAPMHGSVLQASISWHCSAVCGWSRRKTTS